MDVYMFKKIKKWGVCISVLFIIISLLLLYLPIKEIINWKDYIDTVIALIMFLTTFITFLVAFFTYQIANQSYKIQKKAFEIENKNYIQNQYDIINEILSERQRNIEKMKLYKNNIGKKELWTNLSLKILVNSIGTKTASNYNTVKCKECNQTYKIDDYDKKLKDKLIKEKKDKLLDTYHDLTFIANLFIIKEEYVDNNFILKLDICFKCDKLSQIT
ncbi:hypothetical protein SPM_004165 [Spiroplasma melliferum KC3]|uniref:Uncharacterized protein n=4 Tax=Spiroplasma melliferum TaxID=2134 RepID=A0AAI9T3B8_SPIME|nr:hypothetical protein SPM_004165 [Spiroplasma melliferum KC3]